MTALTTRGHLNKELGALDVYDEGDGVVDSHAAGPVTLGDEGGEASAPAVSHGEVDDQVEVVLLQVVHNAPLLLFVGDLTDLLLKGPVHGLHLGVTCKG